MSQSNQNNNLADLTTNRDLYLAINTLSKEQESCNRTLEVYLRAILQESRSLVDYDSITLPQFYNIIASGFNGTPAEFNENWFQEYDHLDDEADGYLGWKATLIKQIVDLREMDKNGTLTNKLRYFGVQSPRQSSWYNFDPFGYLECAMAGSLGGWQPDDDSGRQFVPGKVAVLAKDGSIQTANPEDIPNPIFNISTVTWNQFKDFLFCGQIYE